MLKKLFFISILFLTVSITAQISPQSKKITKTFFADFDKLENSTPALQKKRGFTNYKELITFLTQLAKTHPSKVKISFIGESQKGKKIPMVQLTNPNESEKIKVWMQGGLHGNEPASTEGMLFLLDKLLNDTDHNKLLDNIHLVVVPMANIDGYLKQNRYAANGLDLNRDQTKLMAPESIILKQAFSNFNPEVGVDFHEYKPYRKDFAQLGRFGITSAYDAMFLYSGNLNVPENLRKITHDLFVENARKVLDKNKLSHHDYMSTGKFKGEIQFNQGSSNARSSATNYALTNTISSLIEIRGVGLGRTSFKRRIYSTFIIAISYLETSAANSELIKNEIQKANQIEKDAIVTSIRSIYDDKIKAIDIETERKIDLDVTIRDALKSKPKIIRNRPNGYLIDANQIELIQKLKVLGVEMKALPNDEEIEVEAFSVKNYKRNAKKYEKMNQQTVTTELITQKKLFSKGTYKIAMDQKRSNLVIEILEPEAPNSFVSFGVLKTKRGAILPIYRIKK